jgi:hypothetical protein
VKGVEHFERGLLFELTEEYGACPIAVPERVIDEHPQVKRWEVGVPTRSARCQREVSGGHTCVVLASGQQTVGRCASLVHVVHASLRARICTSVAT